jgi:hypothetical protein
MLLYEFEMLQYLEHKQETEVRRNQSAAVVDCTDFVA